MQKISTKLGLGCFGVFFLLLMPCFSPTVGDSWSRKSKSHYQTSRFQIYNDCNFSAIISALLTRVHLLHRNGKTCGISRLISELPLSHPNCAWHSLESAAGEKKKVVWFQSSQRWGKYDIGIPQRRIRCLCDHKAEASRVWKWITGPIQLDFWKSFEKIYLKLLADKRKIFLSLYLFISLNTAHTCSQKMEVIGFNGMERHSQN